MNCRHVPKCKEKRLGGWILAFGAGVIVASFCPTNIIMLLLAIALVLLGIAYLKCP